MPPRFSLTALLLGNFVTGIAVLGPAAMISDLSQGLGITIRDAGFLITAGAVILCFGSPLTAWLTGNFDRRLLLAATMLVLAIGHLASAFAPDYYTLLVIRVSMLSIAALYTPQAAGTAALLVPEERRAAAISFVFIGWSLAAAAGAPIIKLLASKVGWRETYDLIAAVATIAFALQMIFLPSGLKGTPVSLGTWSLLARSRLIVFLLLITALSVSGQFAMITYLDPLLVQLAGATPETISFFFLLFGGCGFVGNVIATRFVGALGAFVTSAICLVSIFVGVLIWALGQGALPVMGMGVIFWGLGFAAGNSMQQARLAAAAPLLAPASIALNTSGIYVGQAVGSYLGGLLIARDQFSAIGWVAVAFMVAALLLLAFTRESSALGQQNT